MVGMKSLIVLAAFSAVALAGVVKRDAGLHHEPSWMQGLDEATKEKFATIFHDHTMKPDAKDAALLNLATQVLSPAKLTEFKTHHEEFKKKHAQWKAAYEAEYAKLSPKAKKAADQLKTIWEDHTMSFSAKKAKTDEIFKGLTPAEQKEVDNLRSHHGHHQPKFMRDLPQETQNKFTAIFHDHSLKGEAKTAALTKLANSALNPQQLAEFNKHMSRMAEFHKVMEERLAKLSPNARKAADAIHAVWENDDLVFADKKAKMDQIKAGLTEAEKAELRSLHSSMPSSGKGAGKASEEE